LPWRTERRYTSRSQQNEPQWYVRPKHRQLVPVALTYTEANAAFIARACNSHDALLAACEAAYETISGGSYHNAPSCEMLRAAISLAKEASDES